MFDPEDRSWIESSVCAQNAEIVVSFCVAGEFYRDLSKREAAPLRLPKVGQRWGETRLISVGDALADPEPLIAYYKTVLALAAEYSQSYDDISHHFWMLLRIVSEAGEIGFPWHDHLEEIDGVLGWLIASTEGDDWHDLEQGWEMIATRVGAKLHFRQGLFDQGGELANLAFSRDELSVSAKQTQAIISQLMPILVDELGDDYWTRYRQDLSIHSV